jgi:hypothetical protein
MGSGPPDLTPTLSLQPELSGSFDDDNNAMRAPPHGVFLLCNVR